MIVFIILALLLLFVALFPIARKENSEKDAAVEGIFEKSLKEKANH